MNDAFAAYKMYLAFKQHFTRDNYDYFRYGGKVSARLSSFENRKDKFFFMKLAKKSDLESFMVANFVERDVSWVRDLLGTEADQIYNEWLKRQQSLSYMFTNDLDKLDDDLNSNLLAEGGQHPKLLKLHLQKEISLESLIILNDVLKFFKHWNLKIQENIIWGDVHRKATKYRPFLKFDKATYKDLIKKRFT